MTDQPELKPCTPPPCPPVVARRLSVQRLDDNGLPMGEPFDVSAASALAVGGWCAPSEVPLPSAFSTDGLEFTLPDFTVSRGGISFDPPSAEEAAAAAAIRAQVLRDVERMARWRDALMDEACAVALANSWDVHVYYHPDYGWTPRYGWTRAELDSARVTGRIGIQFRPAKYAIPTIVEHRDVDATWDDDEDWEASW